MTEKKSKTEEKEEKKEKEKEEKKEIITKKECKICTAYVDGSYNHGTKIGGYGIVFIVSGEVIKEISETLTGPEVTTCTTEVESAKVAIEYAVKNNFEKIIIYYDCECIQHKAETIDIKNRIFQDFGELVHNLTNLELDLIKIKAHSGNKYNNRADRLAKVGSGVKTIM